MLRETPKFVRPSDSQDSLYPTRNKDGEIETLINPNADTALPSDNDSHSNFVYNRHHHLPLDVQQQKLPIFQYRNHILYLMEKYQTLVLIGETGCGKSTQVPQYMCSVGHSVCVTEPRIAACVGGAGRVAAERGGAVGGEVGVAYRLGGARGAGTRVVFMTEGVLLREMFASPLLMQYSCIMLDEVHERSQMIDVLMGLLKKIAKKRKNLKLIISSATMDAEFFRDFFNLNAKTPDAPTSVIMSVQGRTHPVEVFYASEPVPDYVRATIDTVIKIHENEPLGDVLAFLTSQEEILTALETLQQYSEEFNEKNKYRNKLPSGINAYNLQVLPMYGSLPVYRQIRVFQAAEKGCRKVVLATNIAETSITIPGITYVIDSGFHKCPYFDVGASVSSLSVCSVSQSTAVQRAGRAGRTHRGKCYRLYPESEFDKFPLTVPPEMCRSDLSQVLASLAAMGITNILRFPFPTAPPAILVLTALESLCALRVLDRNGGLTEFGSHVVEIPTPTHIAVVLRNSPDYGCMEEILSIVSMLSCDNVFVRSSSATANMKAKVKKRNHFEVAEGDIITYLNIMDTYLRVKSSCSDEKRSKKACKEWCNNMYINHRVMEKALEVRQNLEKLMKKKFNLTNKEFDGPDIGTVKLERVMKCLVSGLFMRAASLSTDLSYRSTRGAKLYLSTDSTLYNGQLPQWVVFASVQTVGDKTYMRDVMKIKKEWLTEIAPYYYKET